MTFINRLLCRVRRSADYQDERVTNILYGAPVEFSGEEASGD